MDWGFINERINKPARPTILWGRGAGSPEERWWRKESWVAGPPPLYNSSSRAPTIPYCRPIAPREALYYIGGS